MRKHVLHVNIDFEEGMVVPDARAQKWAEETLSLAGNKHIPHARVSVGSALMLNELRLALYTEHKELMPYVHFFHHRRRITLEFHGYFRSTNDPKFPGTEDRVFEECYGRSGAISLGIIQETLRARDLRNATR